MKIEDLDKNELNEYDPESDNDIIIWSKDRKLTWNDFKGIPDSNNKYGASTSTIYYHKCDPEIFQINLGYEFKLINIKTFALFRKSTSWVKESVLSSGNQETTLEHEQGHFDISEIFRRKFEKELQIAAKKTYPCMNNTKSRQENADKKVLKILKNIGRIINTKRGMYNVKYENETDHGIKTEIQKQYTFEIKKLLNETGS